MKNISILISLLLAGSLILLSGCASVGGFQTGRTVGAESGELMFSINGTNTVAFEDLAEDEEDFSLFVPNIEIGGRYGVSEKVDFGLRANTNLNISADVKVQFVGDQTSPFAMAAGFGLGMFGFVSTAGGLFNFQIPLYASFHPKENLDFYVSPRYIGQWGTTFEDSSGLINYFGANAGFLVGRTTKFGVDFGYYNLSNADADFNTSLFQIGFGMKFKIGGNTKQSKR